MPLPDGEQEDWCLVEVTGEGLDLGRYTAFVGHPSAGAIASFVGVTRNSFEGKGVLRLEYEAYGPMAVKKLREVCAGMAAQWELVKVAVAHRVGTVAVSEPSVVIAASSAHRKDALEAVHWGIDELKAVVPIWKKEFFTDGSQWKENQESRQRMLEAQWRQ